MVMDGDGDDVVTSLLHTPAQHNPCAVRSLWVDIHQHFDSYLWQATSSEAEDEFAFPRRLSLFCLCLALQSCNCAETKL